MPPALLSPREEKKRPQRLDQRPHLGSPVPKADMEEARSFLPVASSRSSHARLQNTLETGTQRTQRGPDGTPALRKLPVSGSVG